jgi:hypothetical protein
MIFDGPVGQPELFVELPLPPPMPNPEKVPPSLGLSPFTVTVVTASNQPPPAAAHPAASIWSSISSTFGFVTESLTVELTIQPYPIHEKERIVQRVGIAVPGLRVGWVDGCEASGVGSHPASHG